VTPTTVNNADEVTAPEITSAVYVPGAGKAYVEQVLLLETLHVVEPDVTAPDLAKKV
jgi:hypothetical protein